MNTVLTDEQILSIMAQHINHDNDDMRVKAKPFARAIEQAVLQSEQLQAWKKDAESMRGAIKKIAAMDSMSYHSLESAKIVAKVAMEKQP